MEQTEKTPIWLDLKKEYIDDNFAKLQSYLRNCNETGNKDAFYATTIKLFRERINDLLRELSERPLYADENERQQLTRNVNMLATYLLADGDDALALTAYVALMTELNQMNPRLADLILKTIMQRIRYEKVKNWGFSWGDLEKIGTDLFVHNACKRAQFDIPLKKPLIFAKYGTALLNNTGMILTYENKEAAQKLLKEEANTLDTGIGITLRTTSGQKLKQSLSNSIVDMDEYTKDFILTQAKTQNKAISRQLLKSYDDGEEVTVRVNGIENGVVRVETVDPNYSRIEGEIIYERQSLVYYYTNELYKFFHVGDYLTATIKNAMQGVFNIEKQLVTFFVEDTRQVMGSDESYMLAKLIDEGENYSAWLTERGVAVRITEADSYQRGDYAFIGINNYGWGKLYGLIKGYVKDDADETFDEKAARHDCIRAFAESTQPPVYQKPERGNWRAESGAAEIIAKSAVRIPEIALEAF